LKSSDLIRGGHAAHFNFAQLDVSFVVIEFRSTNAWANLEVAAILGGS
jgi:hypothetical protein